MHKRPNMQIVGAKVNQLRREQGLSVYAFARRLAQPVWLISLVELASTENASSLIDLIPDSSIEKLLQEITAVFDVSYCWLTTRRKSPRHPELPAEKPSPVMYLPVALSPEDVVGMLDATLELSVPDSTGNQAWLSLCQQSITTITMLFELQLAVLRQNGQDDLARHQKAQCNELLRQRIEHWKERLGLDDCMLTDSFVA